MIQAGLFDKRIVIEKVTEVQDKGELTETWASFANRWASVTPLRGSERFDAQRVDAEIDHRFNMRYVSGVVPKMRISYDSRLFDVKSVVNVEERNWETEILAREKV